MARRKTVAELEFLLEREKRASLALQEWFICESRGEAPHVTTVVIRPASEGLGPTTYKVLVHGMSRAAGGVAVVQHEAYRDLPRLLDDVILEWSADMAPEVQQASRAMSRARDEAALSPAGRGRGGRAANPVGEDMIDPEDFRTKMALTGRATERFVKVVRQSETLTSVSFINMPPSRVAENRGGGAEASNNHLLFFVRPADGGKVQVSHAINALKTSWQLSRVENLRGRTGTPDAIARYVGEYISRTADAVEPKLTHEAPTTHFAKV